LNPDEVPKIQKEFYNFYLNRTQFEVKLREMRKQDLVKAS